MTNEAATVRSITTYAVLRDKDGNIKSISGPEGEIPPTEENYRKIKET